MPVLELIAEKKAARVLVVDDHPVVRDGLAAQIATAPDLMVCGEAEDLTDALALAAETSPDVVVVDISLRTGNGLDLIKRLKAHREATRVVVWSVHPEDLYAGRALQAGASGYVHKWAATHEILRAIRTVLGGRIYLSEDASTHLLGRLVGGDGRPGRPPIDRLSDRELVVFEHIGRGRTTNQIADAMFLSPKTVETYRRRVKEKLGIGSFTELIQRATHWVIEES